MDTVNKPKKAPVKVERVALSPEANSKVESWIVQLEKKFQGIRIKKSDLLEFFLQKQPVDLNTMDLNALGKEFYDEMDRAAWLVQKLKESKAAGKQFSIEEIMQNNQ